MKKEHYAKVIAALGLASTVIFANASLPAHADITLDGAGLCTIDTGREADTFSCFYDRSTGTGLTFMSFYREPANRMVNESDLVGTVITQMSTDPRISTFVWPDGEEEEIRGFRRYERGDELPFPGFTFWIERGWAIDFQNLPTDGLD